MTISNLSLAQRIARYAVNLEYDDIPEEAVHIVKQRLVDSIGCALGALNEDPVKWGRKFAETLPLGNATIWATNVKVTPDVAAFVNGTAVRYFDFNDGYIAKELAHPSDTIAPCMAVAEAEGASGKELILSVVLAYEIQCRFVDAANLYKRGWDHVNYVLMGATVAAGKLLRLDEDQMTEAINIAVNSHIAMRQVRAGNLSPWKGSSAANASRNGVFSAQLARCGFKGPSPIFEGEMGFMKQITGDFEITPEAFGNGQNKDFVILRTLTKLIATQGEQHTAVFATLEAKKQINDLSAIQSIHVDTTSVAYTILGKDPEKWNPTTRETADHSLPYTVSRALLDGEITPHSYTMEKIHDPRVRELMKKVTVSEDPELTALFPENIPNRITILLVSGKRVTVQKNVMIGGHRSDSMRMTDEHFVEKYNKLLAPIYSTGQSDKLLKLLYAIDAEEDLSNVNNAMLL